MTIDEMLANAALTDDIKLTLPTGDVTVGELRAYKRAKDDVIAASQREADTRNRAANDEMTRAKKLADDALKAIEVAEGMQVTPAAKTGDIDWDIDPVYGPMNKRLSERLTPLEQKLAKLDMIEKTLNAGLAFVTDGYYESRWEKMKDRPKDKSYRDYLKVAEENKIMDRWGLPDPVAAYLKETEADRLTAAVEAARKEGRAEGKKEAAAASMPRPGFQSPGNTKPGDKPLAKNGDLGATLREQMTKAATDPEIMRVAGMID